MSDIAVEWIDRGREPQCAPDPRFPAGIAVDLSDGADKTCTATLSYPAPRCGVYQITCRRCGLRTAITTAGRPDDPRSVTLPCHAKQRYGATVLTDSEKRPYQ